MTDIAKLKHDPDIVIPDVCGTSWWDILHGVVTSIRDGNGGCSSCGEEAVSLMRYAHDLVNIELGRKPFAPADNTKWFPVAQKLNSEVGVKMSQTSNYLPSTGAVAEGRAGASLGSSRTDNPYTKAKQRMITGEEEYDDGRYGNLMDLEAQWDSGFSIGMRKIEPNSQLRKYKADKKRREKERLEQRETLKKKGSGHGIRTIRELYRREKGIKMSQTPQNTTHSDTKIAKNPGVSADIPEHNHSYKYIMGGFKAKT